VNPQAVSLFSKVRGEDDANESRPPPPEDAVSSFLGNSTASTSNYTPPKARCLFIHVCLFPFPTAGQRSIGVNVCAFHLAPLEIPCPTYLLGLLVPQRCSS